MKSIANRYLTGDKIDIKNDELILDLNYKEADDGKTIIIIL